MISQILKILKPLKSRVHLAKKVIKQLSRGLLIVARNLAGNNHRNKNQNYQAKKVASRALLAVKISKLLSLGLCTITHKTS